MPPTLPAAQPTPVIRFPGKRDGLFPFLICAKRLSGKALQKTSRTTVRSGTNRGLSRSSSPRASCVILLPQSTQAELDTRGFRHRSSDRSVRFDLTAGRVAWVFRTGLPGREVEGVANGLPAFFEPAVHGEPPG